MGGTRIAAIGCFVVALLGAGYIGWTFISAGPRDEVQLCRVYMEARAAKPASLRWPGGETVSGAGTFATVFGLVEGEDKYGARSKSRYECKLQELMDGGWQVLSVDG